MDRPLCIVCGRPIAKRIVYNSLRSQEQADRNIGGSNWRTVDTLPRTEEELARLTNAPQITKIYRHGRDGEITAFNTWDGESYKDKYFCSGTCATKQGYASARHGERFVFKKVGA